jgi:EmrB/QacA subfamily drug resistance transporter
MESPPTSGGQPDRYRILVIVLAGVFMAVLDGIVVSIALPTITETFGTDLDQTQWIITAYLVTMTVLLLPAGQLSEWTGRTRLFIAGLSLFTIASAACGFAPSLSVLILARMCQAAGGGLVFSISAAIIFEVFPLRERGRAMGYLGSTVAIASIAGPVVGGVLVQTLGWSSIFFINLPIGLLTVSAAVLYLPRHHDRPDAFHFDYPGALAFGLGMVGLMVLLGRYADEARFTYLSAVSALAMLAGFAAFIRIEGTARNPLVDLALIREPLYILPVSAMTLFFISSFMLNLVGPFYFEGVFGLDPATVGLVFLILPSVMAVTAPISGWLYDRYRYRFLATAGMALVSSGLFLAGYAARLHQLTLILASFVIIGFGGALFQSPNNTDQMSAVPRRWLSLASSVTATGRNIGMSLGVSFASILLTVFLASAGHAGTVLTAEPTVLGDAIGTILVIGSGLTAMAALLSALRGRHAGKEGEAPHP